MPRQAISKVSVRKSGNFTVSGYNEAIDNLNRILDRTSAEALKGEFVKGAMMIRDRAKANAPFNPDRKRGYHLKDAIFAAPGRKDKSDALVGVSRSLRKTGSPSAPHGLLIHEGTKDRVQKTTGRRTGRVNPQPFFKRAVAEMSGPVSALIASSVKNAVMGGIK